MMQLQGGELLQAAKQRIAARIGAGEEHSQPAQHRCEKRVQATRPGKGVPQGGIHARVLGHCAQAKHEGDGR